MRLLRELTCEQSNIKREPDLTKRINKQLKQRETRLHGNFLEKLISANPCWVLLCFHRVLGFCKVCLRLPTKFTVYVSGTNPYKGTAGNAEIICVPQFAKFLEDRVRARS